MTSVYSSSSAGSGSIVSPVKGVTMPKLFYNCLESLKPSAKPVKELKAAIGEIVFNEKSQVIVLEQNKILLPPTSYMAWGFHDRSVRVGAVGTDKSHCVLETNDVYEITCMASADGKVIFGGLTTGTVVVWSLSPPCSSNLASLQLHPKRALDAHTDIVTGLAACPAHNFIVSSSRDHTAVIWHLTQLTFIRQLKGHSGAITALAVNDVKGEIATASGSQLFLWSLNGVQLAVINTAEASLFGGNPSSLILCLGFSTLNEWDARNVVMCGTSDGLVKIYSCELRKVIPAEPEDCVFGSSETSYFGAEPSDVNNSSSRSNKAVKDHLLKRQQRIQNHHYNRKLANKGCANLDVASSNKNSCSSTSSEQQGSGIGANSQQSNVNPATSSSSKDVEWRRSFQLRRVLSEHTAFSQQIANAHPAPITCLRPTKDQRSLLVGDGVGRVWLWTIDNTINSNGTAF
uniref:Uncharacterized protein n=1 Tax=Ditylenchus dipsaci TaxID=166011 RepID=A0A915E9M7_9BILA